MSSPETLLRTSAAQQPMLARLLRLSSQLMRGELPLFALLQSVGTQAFVLAINVVTGVLAARALGPEGRGVYAAVTIWPPLLAALAVAGSSSGIVFQLRTRPEASSSVAGAFALLGIVQSIIAIALGVVLVPVFMATYDPGVVLFAQFCLVSVLVNNAHTWIKQTYAGLGRFRECNLAHLAPQLFYLIALLMIIPFVTIDATDAVLALLVSGALAVLMLLPRFLGFARPGLKGSFAEVRRLSSYAMRAAPMDVVFALATYADRVVLLRLLPASELGLYAVAFSFSRIVQLVQPAIMSVLLSHMSGKLEAGSKQLHDHASRFLLAGLVAGCSLLWVLSESLLVLAYGAEFSAATTVFRLLVIEGSLGVLSQVTAQFFLSRDRPGVVSSVQVIVLCTSVVALLVLTPRYGVIGAGLALVGAAFVRWILLLGALKTVMKLPLPRLYLNPGDARYMLERLR